VVVNMARVWISLSAAELDAMPQVCVVTGRTADRSLTLLARARAGWTWWLLLLGVVPFLVARLFAAEMRILVPVADGAGRRLDQLRLAYLVALVEAVALAAAAFLLNRRDVLVASGAFLLAAGLVRALTAACSVRATLDLSAGGILLTGVHRAFRDEFNRVQQAAWTAAAGGNPNGPGPQAVGHPTA
jgi:hypothetical protein